MPCSEGKDRAESSIESDCAAYTGAAACAMYLTDWDAAADGPTSSHWPVRIVSLGPCCNRPQHSRCIKQPGWVCHHCLGPAASPKPCPQCLGHLNSAPVCVARSRSYLGSSAVLCAIKLSPVCADGHNRAILDLACSALPCNHTPCQHFCLRWRSPPCRLWSGTLCSCPVTLLPNWSPVCLGGCCWSGSCSALHPHSLPLSVQEGPGP